MPFLENLKNRAKKLKSEAQVLMLAYSDKRTPIIAKILIAITVGYLLSPIDLIPDFIPVLGILDDLILVPVLIAISIKLIPKNTLEEIRQQVKDNPQKLKKNNWIFAVIIIMIWLLFLYFIYSEVAFLLK
ncbi:MAG: YkvA family protein [Bacteroidia bacterium]